MSKRRKLENPLASLISTVGGIARSESRLIALQTLVFIIDKHWSKLANDMQCEIRRTLLLLLRDDDEILQSWAYIALSTVVLSSREDSQGQDDWKQVWNFALRKCHLPGTSRSASHAAAILLQSNMLDSTLTIKGIQTLLTSIAVQGPPTVHDSVCALYAIALEIARSDIQLYSLDLEEQVLSWLEKVFAGEKFERDRKMDTQRRFGGQSADPGDVLRLFSAVSRIQRHDVSLALQASLPDSAVVEYALERAKTRPIRDFLLYHTYPGTPHRPASDDPPRAAPSSDHSTSFLDGPPRRLSDLLSGMLDVTIAQWEATHSNPVIISSDNSGERLGRSINLLVLALGFQGLVQLDGYIPHAGCVNASIRLLHLLKPSLTSSDLSTLSLDRVWRGLRCLVDEPKVEQEEEEEWPILVKPDVQSGIRQDLLPPIMYDTPPPSSSSDPVSVPTMQLTQFPPTFPSTSTSAPVTSSSFSTFQNHASPASLVHAIWRLSDVSQGAPMNCRTPNVADSRHLRFRLPFKDFFQFASKSSPARLPPLISQPTRRMTMRMTTTVTVTTTTTVLQSQAAARQVAQHLCFPTKLPTGKPPHLFSVPPSRSVSKAQCSPTANPGRTKIPD